MEEDALRLYRNGDFLFHQDSAPSHTSKLTIKYLNNNNVNFIQPHQWLSSSPDASPIDYFGWGYLKSKINKHQITNINGLKKALINEVKMLQNLINKALGAWSKRCRRIYYNKGKH